MLQRNLDKYLKTNFTKLLICGIFIENNITDLNFLDLSINDIQNAIPDTEVAMQFLQIYLEHRTKAKKRPHPEENNANAKIPRHTFTIDASTNQQQLHEVHNVSEDRFIDPNELSSINIVEYPLEQNVSDMDDESLLNAEIEGENTGLDVAVTQSHNLNGDCGVQGDDSSHKLIELGCFSQKGDLTVKRKHFFHMFVFYIFWKFSN